MIVRQLHGCLNPTFQAVITGDTDDVLHSMTVTPTQHPVTTETGVAPEDDLHFGPDLTKLFDQQGEDRAQACFAPSIRLSLS
jgi:hypothetical protein